METSNQNELSPTQKFREKMKSAGKKEIRGVYMDENEHAEAKRILKLFEMHKVDFILFANSLDQQKPSQ